MEKCIRSNRSSTALPCFMIKTEYPELAAIITAMLDGKCGIISDGDPDIIIEDTDGGVALSSPGISERIILERPFSSDSLHDAVDALTTVGSTTGFYADEENRLAVSGDVSVHLTPTEFRLFSAILKNGDGFISAEKLSEEVWGRCDRNLCTVYISYLRRKLDGVFGDGTLITASGKGYRLRGNFDRSN